jgi:hypothetical protein
LPITRGLGVGIEHGEEVTALFSVIALPDKEVGVGLSECGKGAEKEQNKAAKLAHGY